MELFSKIPIPKSNHPIDYHSKVVSLGSCFADEVGKKFDYFKFQHCTNPFGVLFHPLAMESVVNFALSEKKYTYEDVFFLNERWHCFDVHSAMSHPEKEEMLSALNERLKTTRQEISLATHFIITLGTAWVYKHIETGHTVANCHKVPQKSFEKRLLTVEEIANSIENLVSKVKEVNPEVDFIFTVSPVRHLKDGFVENQLSKSHLIAGLHQVLENKNSPPRLLSEVEVWGASYFPSYEILMDELRDYRFYADDLVHPNQLAVDYIWNRFAEVYFSENTFSTMKEVDTIQKGLAHKPFNPTSASHLTFVKSLQEKIAHIKNKYSHIQF